MRKIILLLLSLLLFTSCGKVEAPPENPPAPEPVIESVQETPPPEEAPQPAPKAEPIEEKLEEKTEEKAPEVIVEAPVEAPEPEKKTLCNLTVSCEKLLSKRDGENGNVIPESGYILNGVQVEFTEGESVFDALKRCLEEREIPLEYREDAIYKSIYIESIGGISEKDFGAYSGWMYKVNGTPPTHGSSEQKLAEGDIIEFYYTY